MVTNQIKGVRELTAQECIEINGGFAYGTALRLALK